MFEDQRSGETLGKLQKVRSDVETIHHRRDQRAFHFACWHRVCDGLCLPRALVDCARVSAYRSVAGNHQFGIKPQDQENSEDDRRRDHRPGRIDDRVAAQYRTGEKSGAGPSGSGAAQRITEKILKLELKKVKYLRSLSFIQGTAVNALRTVHFVPHALSDLPRSRSRSGSFSRS